MSVISSTSAASFTRPDDPEQPISSECASPLPSLLELASLAVAASVELAEIAFHLEYLPTTVRHTMLQHMQDKRLRRLERLLTSSNSVSFAVVAHEPEFQAEWRRRGQLQGLRVDTGNSTDTLFRDLLVPAKNPRRIFWEHHFRSVLRASEATIVTPSGEFVDHVPKPDLALYDDVVEALTVKARELVPRNVTFMLALQKLRRIELHHPAEHNKDTVAYGLESLLGNAPCLEEIGFFHGRLTSQLLQRIAMALTKRQKNIESSNNGFQPVRCVEFVSVKLQSLHDHRELVRFFGNTALEGVRISCGIADFENRRLLDELLALPRLFQLSLEHNDLEDDAFTGLLHTRQRSSPLALRFLRLGNNMISSTTMQTLTSASLGGMMALERLELRNNPQIGDSGIHALAPMLSPDVSCLTHLDVRNCHFGLEGALTLLSALGNNKTLRSLDMSQNFFGSSVGDLLAEFLLTNDSLQRLHVNYVGLGLAGCTERLQLALRTNMSLQVLSVGANRLRDHGAVRVMEAIAVRSRVRPYEALDLSGNLITVDGLHELYRCLGHEPGENDNGSDDERSSKRQRVLPDSENPQSESFIQELGLLNNDLLGSADTTVRVRVALDALHQFVHKVHSNEWTSRRNVYDDEV